MSGNWNESAGAPPQQLEADKILRALLAGDVEFVVIGGLAVGAHGYPRATRDVDVVPAPTAENRRRLHTALLELGAAPLEIGDLRVEELPPAFTPDGLDEGGNWALRTRAGRVDIMQWIPGSDEGYDRLRANAIEIDVPDVGPVIFAGYDDLVTMKHAARRPQDVADLHELNLLRGG